MAQCIPISRPDRYSTSGSEVEDPNTHEVMDITEPIDEGVDDDDSGGSESEVEGFMFYLASDKAMVMRKAEKREGNSEVGFRVGSWCFVLEKVHSLGARGNIVKCRLF